MPRCLRAPGLDCLNSTHLRLNAAWFGFALPGTTLLPAVLFLVCWASIIVAGIGRTVRSRGPTAIEKLAAARAAEADRQQPQQQATTPQNAPPQAPDVPPPPPPQTQARPPQSDAQSDAPPTSPPAPPNAQVHNDAPHCEADGVNVDEVTVDEREADEVEADKDHATEDDEVEADEVEAEEGDVEAESEAVEELDLPPPGFYKSLEFPPFRPCKCCRIYFVIIKLLFAVLSRLLC